MAVKTQDQDLIDHKVPTWNVEWTTYSDYVLRVELRADATKKDELPLLGPRLAGNLVGRAFDSIADINREELRKEQGWRHLLTHLEAKRGKEKIDLLGDLFTEFFVKKDTHRRDGEDLADFEPRFRLLVRRLDKAVKESGADGKIPTELYGWMLLNMYMRLDASDTANVRGRADSYKLEDIISALKKMWSGGGLCARDLERKKKKEGHAYVNVDHDENQEQERDGIDGGDDEELPDEESVLAVADATAWYQETLQSLLEEPEDATCLANFKDARRALDAARTARGFYPVKNPNARSSHWNDGGRGYGKRPPLGRGPPEHANKKCLRCGKFGHIARQCPQKPVQGRGRADGGDNIGYVAWTESESDACAHVTDDGVANATVFQANAPSPCTHAILDSGASDNIVGVETLQDWGEQIEKLGFSPDDELFVDRSQHKRFTFGNNASAAALGKAYVNVGLFGCQTELEFHVVEGTTPFLLSAKFLADQNASVNFRTGVALLRKISDQHFQLSRTSGGHLVLPLLAFPGNERTFKDVQVKPDPGVQELATKHVRFEDSESNASKGRPEDSH